MDVEKLRELLNLQPHPEGGFYAETFRDDSILLPPRILPPRFKVERPVSTAIYFLLPSGSISHLHRIPSAEVWHFYGGEPLTVFVIDDNGKVIPTVLGSDLAAGQKLQHTVQPMVWFGAYPTKDVSLDPEGNNFTRAPVRNPNEHYSLVGCTVSPGFQFEDFELAKRSQLLELYPHAKHYIELLTHAD